MATSPRLSVGNLSQYVDQISTDAIFAGNVKSLIADRYLAFESFDSADYYRTVYAKGIKYFEICANKGVSTTTRLPSRFHTRVARRFGTLKHKTRPKAIRMRFPGPSLFFHRDH